MLLRNVAWFTLLLGMIKMIRESMVVWFRMRLCITCLCFFFQAEDGIRDLTVTGVQTCALPISWTFRLDDPTRETARRDRLERAWLPVAWSNSFGGFTIGLRERTNYLGSYDRGQIGRASCRGRV